MATSRPQSVGNDPAVVRTIENRLAQASIVARGQPTVSNNEAIFPGTVASVSGTSVTVAPSTDSADITTISSNGVYVTTLDQTVNNYKLAGGVNQVVAGNNITISSTLTSGTGIVTVNANVGNVALLYLDGNASNVLHGDGSWSADITTYGNSNVVSLLAAFGSNTITTTGNVSVGNLNVAGNVTSNLLPNANVTYNLGSNTQRWNDIWLANSTIYLGDASLTANGNSIVVDSITVTNGNIGTIGNVASLNLDGSGSNVLYGNGVFAPASGGNASLPIANGNSNINIATANGPVTLTSAGQTWTVGTDGTLTAPNNSNIYPAGNNFNVYAPVAGAIQFYTDGGNFNWSLDGYGVMNLPFASAMSNTALIYSAGNLRLDAGANNFMFTDAGTVVFPTLTVDLHNGGNQYAQTLQFGDDTQQAVITGPTPAANVNAQRLIIQGQRGNGTGEGGDVYFWAGDADTNGGDIKIYAGDADNVSAGYGGYINLDGGSGYDGGGQITISGGSSANGPGGTVYVTAGNGADAGDLNLAGGQSSTAGNDGGNANLTGGYGQNNGGAVTITGGQSALGLANYGNVYINSGASTWTFDNTGTLTVPQNINGNGALQLQGLANGNTTINIGSGVGGDIDMVSNLGNINLYTANNQPWIFDQGGNLTAPGAINVGNMVIGTVPGDITADANTGVTFNVSGPNGGFAVNYLDEVGNANTSGGELAFNSELGNATYRISLSDDLGDGFATKIWRFDGTGNLTLPGNTFAVNYANGTQVPLGGGGNTGNVTFNDINIIGTGNLHLQPDPANSSSYLDIFLTSGPDLHLVASAAANLILGKDDGPNVMTSWDGNVYVQSWNTGSNTQGGVWNFGEDGNLVLAGGNSVIQSVANSSLDPLNPNVSTMTLTPDANYSSQVLVLDPTAPGHIHLRALSFGNIDDPAANIFLGGEATSFEITYGSNNEARIHSNNYTWTYGNDGALSFPRDAVGNTDPYLVITGGPAPAISSVDVSLAGPANLQLVSDYLNLTGYTGAKVVVRADDGEIMADANMVLTTNAANVGNEFSWTFATDGSLTLAGNLISSGASPAPSISGFSSISTLVSLNTPVAYSSLTAIAGLRAFINDANLVAAGNFGQQVSGGGANSTPVWSDGTNWYIG